MMTNYLLEYLLSLAVMLALYKLILSKSSLHQLKRYYLLACLLIPLGLPLLQVNLYYDRLPILSAPVVTPTEVLSDWPEHFDATVDPERPLAMPELVSADNTIDQTTWLIAIYSLTVMLLLIRLVTRVLQIHKTARNADFEHYHGHKVYLLEKDISPYSFFKLIFMSKSDYEADHTRDILLIHELAHSKGYHSLDILLMEFVRAFFWFNPLYTFLGKSIKLNHEYIADSEAVSRTGDRQTYQNLLLNFSIRSETPPAITSPSDFSFIKNRFTMMTQSTSKKGALIRMSLLVPVLALSLFSFIAKPQSHGEVMPTEDYQNSDELPEYIPTGFPVDSVKYSGGILDFGLTSPSNWTEDSSVEHHEGIDITSSAGRHVVATAEGTVEKAETNDEKYGNYVLISHGAHFKTIYASLSSMDVKAGDAVEEGQKIGVIGTSMKEPGLPETVHKVHYGIAKDGKWVNPRPYMSVPKMTSYYTYLNIGHKRDFKMMKVHDMARDHIKIEFPLGFPYKEIVYDREKAIFFSESESIVKKVDELSDFQWKTLRRLTSAPPYTRTKRPPTAAIADQWTDPEIYGIWIDGKRVSNEEMANYTVDDFAMYFKSRVLKNAKNYGKHQFQLNLSTNAEYERNNQRSIKKRELWESRTQIILDQLGAID